MRSRIAHGFTLIEVMAAVVVLAVGISGIMAFMARATRVITDARNATIQACLARDVMVNVENLYWRKQSDKVRESDNFGSEFPGYRYEVRVTEDIDEEVKALTHVDVTVYRATSGGSESAFTLSTYLLDFRK